MKKIISGVVIGMIILFVAILYFKERTPDVIKKSKNEIRLENELIKLSKKYDIQEKEKDAIYQDYLKEKNKKPVVKWKKKIIVKKIDLKLWVEKELYDSLKSDYISLSNYTDYVEKSFQKYRDVDSISLEDHKKIIQNLTAQRDYQEYLKIKYFKKSKRRIFVGAFSGYSLSGKLSIGAGLIFRIF